MSCSICQSITFQAIAGSRLDGSVRYARVSVPPCLGWSEDEEGLLPPPSLVAVPHAASPSASTSTSPSTATVATAPPLIERRVIAASLDVPIQ